MIRWSIHFCCIAALVLPATMAFAQDADPETPPQETATDERPPSLDELLGIDGDEKSDGAEEAASREADEELQRVLSEQEISDAFEAALEKMQASADRLDVRFDAGLGTQRIQEDILRKLDQLIDMAKKQQSQSSSSSSSSSSSQQQQQQSPGESQSQQQQQAQRNPNPNESGENDPPPRQEGDINTVLEESRTEWGGLRPRARDELLQGRDDDYSSLYDQLTREYYRRLAEEGTP